MSIVALVLVATSFTWLGTLLIDRSGAARSRPIESASPINAVRAPAAEGKQTATGVAAPVQVATTRSAGADGFVVGLASKSPSDTATPLSSSEASNGASGEGNVGTRQAGTPSTTDVTEPSAGVEPLPEGEQVQRSRPLAHVESATFSNSPPATRSAPTRRGPAGESRHFAPSPNGGPGAMQEQWALLRPPTRASPAADGPAESSGSTTSRRALITPATVPADGDASGLAEQLKHADASAPQADASAPYGQKVGTGITGSPSGSNASTVTLDNDPARRERWLREQLQIR